MKDVEPWLRVIGALIDTEFGSQASADPVNYPAPILLMVLGHQGLDACKTLKLEQHPFLKSAVLFWNNVEKGFPSWRTRGVWQTWRDVNAKTRTITDDQGECRTLIKSQRVKEQSHRQVAQSLSRAAIAAPAHVRPGAKLITPMPGFEQVSKELCSNLNGFWESFAKDVLANPEPAERFEKILQMARVGRYLQHSPRIN
jgi:hypothetical protein